MRIAASLHGLVDDLVDLVLPRACVGCAAAGTLLCPACLPADGLRVAAGLPVPVLAAGDYDAALRTAVLAYKERGRRDLARPLGTLLAAAVEALVGPAPALCLVPVPSSAAAARARGGDHVRRLARVACRQLRAGGRPAGVAPTLRLVRRVDDSSGLGARERAANLAGALAAGPPVAGLRAGAPAVVLVDDIATTGATLREAVRALRAAGWPVDGAAVVAATPAPQEPAARRRHRSRAGRGHTGTNPGEGTGPGPGDTPSGRACSGP